jgi:adenylate cyclase, class 2
VTSNRTRRVHEWNELFDTPGGELKRRGELLRIRTETLAHGARRRRGRSVQRTIVTFKYPIRGKGPVLARGSAKYKVREEIEAELLDGRALAAIFAGMGLRVWFRYEKYRTTFRLAKAQRWSRKLCIELDETPMGLFVELEGPQRAIDRVAKALGYRQRDYITANYFVLYRDYCRQRQKNLGDMVFQNESWATRGD